MSKALEVLEMTGKELVVIYRNTAKEGYKNFTLKIVKIPEASSEKERQTAIEGVCPEGYVWDMYYLHGIIIANRSGGFYIVQDGSLFKTLPVMHKVCDI